jgi:CheY-like chemotaxis protein
MVGPWTPPLGRVLGRHPKAVADMFKIGKSRMAGKHVLVVDDESRVRDLLQSLLRRLGHTSQAVAGGGEALGHIEKGSFDLFLVDFNMPEMKGDELAREIKKRKPGAPVILITGTEPARAFPEFDRLLLKPFSLSQLSDTISSVA